MMEKRSSFKIGLHKEKIQSSCMRRLTDVLNCEDDRNNQKLLSNGKPSGINNEAVHQLKRADVLYNSTVKNKHIQVTTPTEKQPKKSNIFRKKQDQSSSPQSLDRLQKNSKSPKSQSEERFIPENHQLALWSDEMSVDKQKLATTLNEICHQIYQETNGDNVKINTSPSNLKQLDEADRRLLESKTKAFIHHIYITRGSHSKSKQFLDAAEILRLNMDVFLKFLRDPYSLFVKNIRNFPFLQDLKGKERDTNRIVQRKLEYENPSSTQSQLSSNKKLAFMSKLRVKNNADDVSSDCASVQSRQNSINKNRTTRSTSLSFKDVKQTLKQAVGENKKKLRSSLNRKVSTEEETISDAKKRENKLKYVDFKGKNEIQPPLISKTVSTKIKSVFTGKKKQVDMSVKTKQKLCERLNNVHLDEILPKKEILGTLEKVVSSYDRRHYSNLKATTHSSFHNTMLSDPKKVEYKPDISDNINAVEAVDMCSSTYINKKIGSEGTLEANAVVPSGNTKVLAMLYEPISIDAFRNKQIPGKTESIKGYKYKESLKLDRAENRPYRSFSDPSSPLHIQKLQIADDVEDKEENTSPISVLEPFSPDDVTGSPISILSEPAKSDRFHFDVNTCMYLYVRNIIQFSDMSFHELFAKRNSLKNRIISCPNDGIARLANELKCDYKLLLDCIHETMVGVYRIYYGRNERSSFLEQPDTLVPLEERFINEVVKQVNFYVLQKTDQPPIDQLVGKDLAMCSSWLEFVNDTEDILIKVAEGVLLDSIVDTIHEVRF